jgi:hypothetical protein
MTNQEIATALDGIQKLVSDLRAKVMQGVPSVPTTIFVAPGQDLQAMMTGAEPGTVIELQAGATYLGNFESPSKIALVTKGTEDLVGRRITPADLPRLATLTSTNNQPSWRTQGAADGCTIARIALECVDSRGTALAVGTGAETALEQLPKGVRISQVLVQGGLTGLKRGIALHGQDIAVEDSHIDGCRIAGQDSQAIWVNNGPGPFFITNNFLEAAGENLLFGGDRVSIMNAVPTGRIEDNTLFKPPVWKGQKGWNVKNLLEIKNGRGLVIRDNVLDGCWPDAQTGYAVLFTPKDQYGDNPWVTIEDCLFEGNTIRNTANGINIYGCYNSIDSDGKPAQRMKNLTIRNNRVLVDKVAWGGDGRALQIGGGPDGLTLDQNTFISNGSTAIYTYGPAAATVLRAVFHNNIWVHNAYGFSGEGTTGNPLATLVKYYPDLTWTGNVIGGGIAKQYPTDSLMLTTTDFQKAFTDIANGVIDPNGPLKGKGAQ